MVFFFALYESDVLVEADEAHDAKDIEHALAIAVEASRDIMSSDIKIGRLPLSAYIVVQDDQHVEVGKVRFRDTVEVL